jgi:hypothetical protein
MKLNEAKQILKQNGFIAEALNPKRLPKKCNREKIIELADLIKSGADVPVNYSAIDYYEDAEIERNDIAFKAAVKTVEKYFRKKIDAQIEADMARVNAEVWKKDPRVVLKGDAPRPSNDDRAEDDSDYMGTSYEYYDLDDPCSDEEWSAAGKQWAKDMLNNGEFSKQDYKDAMRHYHVYEFEDDWEPSDED